MENQVKSHVIVPKLILKNFCTNGTLYYLKITNGKINKSNAYLGSMSGYYNMDTEMWLSSNIEQPFGVVSKKILQNANGDIDLFTITDNDLSIVRDFFKAALIREPLMFEHFKNSSTYLNLLTGDNTQRKIELAIKVGFATTTSFDDELKDTNLYIFKNSTDLDFVCPFTCIYSGAIKSCKFLFLPLSPKVILGLSNCKAIAQEEQRCIILNNSSHILALNSFAFNEAKSVNLTNEHTGDYIASISKKPLENLVKPNKE